MSLLNDGGITQHVASTHPNGRQNENKHLVVRNEESISGRWRHFHWLPLIGDNLYCRKLRNVKEDMREAQNRILLHHHYPSSPPQLEIWNLVHYSQIQSPRAPRFSCTDAALHYQLILVLSDLNLIWHFHQKRLAHFIAEALTSPINTVHPVFQDYYKNILVQQLFYFVNCPWTIPAALTRMRIFVPN